MGVTYYKRFRMEVQVRGIVLPEARLPESYQWVSWQTNLMDRHALAKFESFQSQIDSQVFPCLGEFGGCRRLMGEIAGKHLFLPECTWLINFQPQGLPQEDCGTIQGVAYPDGLGAIQNVGVVPNHRGLGMGRALVLKSLAGFQQAGMERVYLDVTARNWQAVQLYRSLGFRLVKTSYKAVETAEQSECVIG